MNKGILLIIAGVALVIYGMFGVQPEGVMDMQEGIRMLFFFGIGMISLCVGIIKQ